MSNRASSTADPLDAAQQLNEIAEEPGDETPKEAPNLEKLPRFAALRYPNFRLFWMGNLLSLLGTMAQNAAQGWLMRLLTPHPFTISAVAACSTLPFLLFTLYAGALADRVDKRRALLITNGAAAILALVLGALVWLHLVQVWHVAVLALLSGVVNAFDVPVRQSFNAEMVGREELPNAIALNSTAFNGARVAGPAVGGFLMGTVGLAGCFFVNAVSFAALICGLARMRDLPAPRSRRSAGWADIAQGFFFVRRHPTLWLVTLLVAAVSLCAMSFGTLLPVFAKDVFGSNEKGFSLLLTCNGVGALVSTVSLAVAGEMRHRGKRLLLGAFAFCLSVAAFSHAPNLHIGCLILIVAGWCLLTFLTTANTFVQTLAPDAMRGRVFSVYSLALIGTAPLGALLIGALAQSLGARLAVQSGAGLAAAFALGIYLRFRRLWKEK